MEEERNSWFRPVNKVTYAEGSMKEKYRQAYSTLPVPYYVTSDVQRSYVPQSEDHLF